jgi:hypothetical protein
MLWTKGRRIRETARAIEKSMTSRISPQASKNRDGRNVLALSVLFNPAAPRPRLIPSVTHWYFRGLLADQAMGELRHDTHFRRQYRKVHGPLGLPNFVATSMKVRLFKPETGMIKGLSTALLTDLVDILHDGYSVAHLLFLAWYEQPLCRMHADGGAN